jgi:hypothetical protein
MAVKSDGSLVAWGLNSFGQGAAPQGLSMFSAIAAGQYFNVAILGLFRNVLGFFHWAG